MQGVEEASPYLRRSLIEDVEADAILSLSQHFELDLLLLLLMLLDHGLDGRGHTERQVTAGREVEYTRRGETGRQGTGRMVHHMMVHHMLVVVMVSAGR